MERDRGETKLATRYDAVQIIKYRFLEDDREHKESGSVWTANVVSQSFTKDSPWVIFFQVTTTAGAAMYAASGQSDCTDS